MALKPKDAPDLSRFDWEDAFRMEDQLTEEERNALNHGVENLLQKGLFEQDDLLADVAAALDRLGGGMGNQAGGE